MKRIIAGLLCGMLLLTAACSGNGTVSDNTGAAENSTGAVSDSNTVETAEETEEAETEFVYVEPEANGYIDGLSLQNLIDSLVEEYPDGELYYYRDSVYFRVMSEDQVSSDGVPLSLFSVDITPFREDQIRTIEWESYVYDRDSLDFLLDWLDVRGKKCTTVSILMEHRLNL